MILYRRNDLHIFGFTPLAKPEQRKQTVGFAARWRRSGDRWRHASVCVYWPRRDLRTGRGLVSFEVATWQTRGGTAVDTRYRVGLKAFFRVKLGLGGSKSC